MPQETYTRRELGLMAARTIVWGGLGLAGIKFIEISTREQNRIAELYPELVMPVDIIVPRHAVLLKAPIYHAKDLERPEYEKVAVSGGAHPPLKVSYASVETPPADRFQGNPKEASLIKFPYKNEGVVFAHFSQIKIPETFSGRSLRARKEDTKLHLQNGETRQIIVEEVK